MSNKFLEMLEVSQGCFQRTKVKISQIPKIIVKLNTERSLYDCTIELIVGYVDKDLII